MRETIARHGVVVEHKGFKIGDGIFVKHKKIKGIVTGIDTSNVYSFRVEGERYASWTTCDNIEHLADYELRKTREEFERKFKGKKIRLEGWDDGKYVIFDSWGAGYVFNCTGNEGDKDFMFADKNCQILEEPEEPHSLDNLKVGDVIENYEHERQVIDKYKGDNTFKVGSNCNWFSIEELKERGYKKKEQSE